MYMLTTRLYQMDEGYRKADHEDALVLLDRGAVGDTVFALLNHQMNNMDDEEINIYKSVCQQRMPASISERVDIVLYLDVSPNECHRRVTKERLNEAEEGIPLSYLEAVDDCYFHLLMDWFGNRKGSYHELNIGKPPQIIVLRWENYGDCREAIKEIQKLIDNSRNSPTVEFTKDLNTIKENIINENDILTLDTSDEIEYRYKLLLEQQYHCFDNNEHLKSTLHINWDLPHTNSFKRIVMLFLSLQGKVVFYGKSTIPNGVQIGI